MKKYFLLVTTMLVMAATAFAVEVPRAVTEAFTKKFPGATAVKWGKENKNEYEAEFKLNGRSVSANFLSDGSWVETETEINVSELPAAVSAAIQKADPGAILLSAEKVEKAKAIPAYEVQVKAGGKKKEMVLHEDGSMAE